MQKKLTYLAFGSAFLGMGIAMPSCPGQQAMQQQVDSLQQTTSELARRNQALDQQVRSLNADMNTAKQLMSQMANAIQAQKTALEGLDASIKQLQARSSASPRSTKSSKKRH